MDSDYRIFLLAYPDNPVGQHFIRAFHDSGVRLTGIILETGAGGGIWKRLKKKLAVDGILRTLYRLLQVYTARLFRTDIAALARRFHIDVFSVRRFNSRECRELLKRLEIDLLVIASAPILKKNIFEQARLGCLNAHPGWLPAYRGLGANAYAVKNGDLPGVTVHFIDAGIDTGRIITREHIALKPRDTIARINDRAVARGAVLVTEVIRKMQNNTLEYGTIDEPVGENYTSMLHRDVRKINKKIRDLL